MVSLPDMDGQIVGRRDVKMIVIQYSNAARLLEKIPRRSAQ